MKRFIVALSICILFSLLNAEEQRRKALIFGVTGQDGSYLAELLLDKGYEVHGVRRRTSLANNVGRINHLCTRYNCGDERFFLHYGDLTDSNSITTIIKHTQPDEIYNLAAQSHVQVSFEIPDYTGQVDALGTMRILEAIHTLGMTKKVKFYQASTSELYGKVQQVPQDEDTPFYPRSPYGVAKVYAFWITKQYREAYGIFAVNGILFNHESPRRGETFVTRKIAIAVARIAHGLQQTVRLGNLNAERDWGHARDFVEAMWLMLQQDEPQDFVIATGKKHSVREFVELAFKEIGVDIEWQGQGIDEIGIDRATNIVRVRIDPTYFRPAEVDYLLGNAKKAHMQLRWYPKVSFQELVHEMVQAELQALKEEKV